MRVSGGPDTTFKRAGHEADRPMTVRQQMLRQNHAAGCIVGGHGIAAAM